MIKHKVIVRDRKITVDNPKIVQNTSESDQIVLDLDSDWDSVTPVIVLGSGSKAQVAYYDDETVFPEDLTEKVGPVPLSIVGIARDIIRGPIGASVIRFSCSSRLCDAAATL